MARHSKGTTLIQTQDGGHRAARDVMSAAGPVGEVCSLATCGNANGNASSVIDRNGQLTSDLHDRLNLPVFTRFKAVGRSGNFPSTVNASLRYAPQTPPVEL